MYIIMSCDQIATGPGAVSHLPSQNLAATAIQTLPFEVWSRVFSYMSVADMVRAQNASRVMQCIGRDTFTANLFLERELGSLQVITAADYLYCKSIVANIFKKELTLEAFLQKCKKAHTLRFSQFPIQREEELAAIAKHKNLKNLSLCLGPRIRNGAFLEAFGDVEHFLFSGGSGLTDVVLDFSSCHALKSICFDLPDEIGGTAGLSKLPELKDVRIARNTSLALQVVSQLKDSASLRVLHLNECLLTDVLSTVCELNRLRELDLSYELNHSALRDEAFGEGLRFPALLHLKIEGNEHLHTCPY